LGKELKVSIQELQSRAGLNEELTEEIAVSAAGREPLIVLGDVGIGKTMFLRRLLRVEAADLADDTIALYVDLGRSAVLSEDIQSHIAASLRDQLFAKYRNRHR
jgi:MoxR-like ATPase